MLHSVQGQLCSAMVTPGVQSTTHSNANGTSIKQSTTAGSDADLAALSTEMGYNQALFDINILSFDISPAVSGKITFSYVFGSEEYEEYSPNPSKCC
jgi:hypothetical protein